MNLEALVLQLHDQLSRGASEDELEATRASLDDAWAQMGDGERHLYAGLLHDLKSLRGRDVALEGLCAADENAQLATSRDLAQKGAWEAALRVLRGVVPDRAKRDIAEVRAQAWKELGFERVAERF